ncbi:ribulose-phosphate 3-epimerase [Brevibacillus choshinensis]|uniref:Ribulose-phosphate 3-epimerase n=1 Tax=Brevibacillus choshinensis TaxID=54911 RepID=A0ABX7FLM8_BRECH|nr:ribulose-phosphate 3-epimerase [Brevibacillus choshinensis]QRG67159.1 ribulose-phosphate 3-epimerase [Brevibacillus choshinensis]
MIISPSIASADPLRLEEEVNRLDPKLYSDLHVDIEDGHFIPNITFGMKTVKRLREVTDLPFSFHLMVSNPFDYLEEMCACQPSVIFAHVEALEYPSLFVDAVRGRGGRVGLAFNPRTPIAPFGYVLGRVDAVLVMTAEPDGVGQEFLPDMVTKAQQVRDAVPSVELWVDGGVTPNRLGELTQAGVTHAVMGRAVFGRG